MTAVDVCLQHCTPLYVATTLADSELAQQCFTPQELAVACTLATAAHSNQTQLVQALADKSPVLAKYPAWSAEQRPASAMRQLQLQLRLPLQPLKEVFECSHEDSSAYRVVYGTLHIWQGARFQLQMQLDGTDNKPGLEVAGFVSLYAPAAAVCQVTCSFELRKPRDRPQCMRPFTATFSNGDSWGEASMLQLHQASWAATKAHLRAQDLVHSNGCLHLHAAVMGME